MFYMDWWTLIIILIIVLSYRKGCWCWMVVTCDNWNPKTFFYLSRKAYWATPIYLTKEKLYYNLFPNIFRAARLVPTTLQASHSQHWASSQLLHVFTCWNFWRNNFTEIPANYNSSHYFPILIWYSFVYCPQRNLCISMCSRKCLININQISQKVYYGV